MASIGSVGKIDSGDLSKMVVGASTPARANEGPEPVDASPTLTQISATGKLQQSLSQLADVGRRLSRPETWQTAKATSSAPDVVDATTQQAVEQKIQVQVDQVATAQTTVAPMFSPLATPIGLGTLHLELGNWNSTMSSFTTNPNWPKASISTGAGDTSVERIRDKINAAGIGIYANVVSDVTGTYLILRAATPGQSNGFRITAEVSPEANADQARFMKAMEFDPPANANGMQLTQAAQDAVLQINGQSQTSSSNFVEDAVPGVDVTAKKPSATPVDISIKPDRDGAKALVEDFVNAFNDLQDLLADRTDDLPPSVAHAAQTVQQNIQAVYSDSSGDPAANTLRQSLQDLGVSMNAQQRLTLDARQLDRHLADHASQPEALDELARQLTRDSTESDAKSTTWQTLPASNTSALFRQAVLEQYAHAMYSEDVH